MNTFLYAYIILFHRKLSVVFIILTEDMNQINSFLSHFFTFFGKSCASIPFLCTKNQERKSIFAFLLYLKQWVISPSQQYAVCQAPKLYSWYLSPILKYMQQKCSPCTHLKPFSIYILHLKHNSVGQLHGY